MVKVTQELHYYVYIIACEDGSYYTGYAKNVERRVKQHKKGRGARYTRTHKPKKIVYVEEFHSRGQAMKRELEIKLLSHDRKQRLATQYSKLNG